MIHDPTRIQSSARSAFLGSLVADAFSMPVHWYYNQQLIDSDYPDLIRSSGYLSPKNPHPDSILWRSQYSPPSQKFDILREQSQYWGQRGIHYHQFLSAGENTLNFRLAAILFDQICRQRDYDPEAWLDRYITFMLTPGQHNDTYLEEYHRHFFNNLAAHRKPINCGVRDIHIGGLVAVPAIVAALGPMHHDLKRVIRLHVSLTHKDDDVLAAADVLASILVRTCQGDQLREVILAEARDWISTSKIENWSKYSDRHVVGNILSPACYIKDAFPAALYLAWQHADDFQAGITTNARCGGDSCHRGAVVGSLLGVSSHIPDELLEHLALRDTV
ncbi:MAG: ADP-ribosylglycohydrolase family protein [Pirellulales bacterium]